MEGEVKKSSKAFAIVALIMGILAIINSFIPFLNVVSYIFAILGIIFGIIGIVKKNGKVMAIIGLVLAGVSMILATVINGGTASLIEEGGSSSSSSSSSSSTNSGNSSKVIEYTPVDIDTLEDALDNNAAAAKDTYNGKYFAITGKLSVIDSDLKYISIVSTTDEWDIIGVHCTIKNEKTREAVKTLSKDQIITVKGKITDVGEVLGYYLNIDEIVVQ